MKAKELKQVVKEKYSAIADRSVLLQEQGCCVSESCCDNLGFSMIGDDYQSVSGYNQDADLGLGCGIPTQYARLKPGDHVLDLGSGAGNDCFVARSIVGETGKVTGLDFTESMIEKSIKNNLKLGFSNVEFVKGDIEKMPFQDNRFDVILSNCVLNLVPDKTKAFSEIFRVLKNDGHFCVSDVVVKGELPKKLKNDAEMYVGCVSGAIAQEAYLEIIGKQGFQDIVIHKERKIEIPVNILLKYMNQDDLKMFEREEIGIYSITVSATKK